MTDEDAPPATKKRPTCLLVCGALVLLGSATLVGLCLRYQRWRHGDLEVLSELEGGKARVEDLVFTPDGHVIVMRGAQGLRAWTVADGVRVAGLDVARLEPGLAAGPGGLVAVGRTLRQLPDLREVRELAAPALAFMPDGQSILAIDGEGPVLLRTSDGQMLARFGGPWPRRANLVSPLGGTLGFRAAFSTSGPPRLAIAGRRRVCVHALPAGELLWEAEAPGLVGALGFTPDGSTLRLLGARDELQIASFRAWSAADGTIVAQREEPASTRTYSRPYFAGGALHPDGARYVYTSIMADVSLRDAAGAEVMRGGLTPAHGLVAVALSPDGKLLAAGGTEAKVFLWAIDPPVR